MGHVTPCGKAVFGWQALGEADAALVAKAASFFPRLLILHVQESCDTRLLHRLISPSIRSALLQVFWSENSDKFCEGIDF